MSTDLSSQEVKVLSGRRRVDDVPVNVVAVDLRLLWIRHLKLNSELFFKQICNNLTNLIRIINTIVIHYIYNICDIILDKKYVP